MKTYSETLESVALTLARKHHLFFNLDIANYSLAEFVKAYNATGLRALKHLSANPNPLDVKRVLRVHWSQSI